jgi:hypothetical protein
MEFQIALTKTVKIRALRNTNLYGVRMGTRDARNLPAGS